MAFAMVVWDGIFPVEEQGCWRHFISSRDEGVATPQEVLPEVPAMSRLQNVKN